MVSLLSAYQKIGTDVEGLSPEDALVKAGLHDWNQRLVPVTILDTTLPIPFQFVDPGKFMVNVADVPVGYNPDGTLRREPKALAQVLNTYRPFQLEDQFLPLLDQAAAGGRLQVNRMGAYNGGRAAFAAFNLADGGKYEIGGDEFKRTVVISTRLDGQGSAVGVITDERVFCANQLTGLLRRNRPSLRVRHTRNADPYIVSQLEVLLGLTDAWDTALAREVRRLQETTVTRDQYLKKVVPAALGWQERPGEKGRSQTVFDRKFEQLVAAWDSPVHADGDTAWRAYSAVTEVEQHHRVPNQQRLAEAVLNGRQPATARVLASVLA